MNPGYLHLLINHLPIIGTLLGSIVLIIGIATQTHQTKITGYYLLLISTAGACIAYFTGEAAEEVVENVPTVLKSAIQAHESFAIFALISMVVLGVVALFGLFLTIYNSPYIKTIAILTVFVSFISFGFIARTGFLGGQIRHTEFGVDPSITSQPMEKY